MRPIDGDDMLRRINFLLATTYTPAFVEILTALKEYLENAPTLTLDDLRPKGRCESKDARYARCTNCNKERNIRTQIGCEFCPRCGADMLGGGEDG